MNGMYEIESTRKEGMIMRVFYKASNYPPINIHQERETLQKLQGETELSRVFMHIHAR